MPKPYTKGTASQGNATSANVASSALATATQEDKAAARHALHHLERLVLPPRQRLRDAHGHCREGLATLAFEDGTKVTAELCGGFPAITLPQSADVNNDGKVTYTAMFEVVATVQKIWVYGATLGWDSEMGCGDYSAYLNTYDLKGNKTGETKTNYATYGPLRKSGPQMIGLGEQKTLEWTLGGLTPIVATRAIQGAPVGYWVNQGGYGLAVNADPQSWSLLDHELRHNELAGLLGTCG